MAVPEASAFQEEGAAIAKAKGQARACGCEEQGGSAGAALETVRAAGTEVGGEGREVAGGREGGRERERGREKGGEEVER